MVETVKVRFTNCNNTQVFIINIGVLLIKVVGEVDIHDWLNFKSQRDLDINMYMYIPFPWSNKLFFATGDFNVLDYNKNVKVTKFLNLTFAYDLVPVINKPTRVTKNTATSIDPIITNSLLHRAINTGIIKLDISNHFPIFW